VSAAQLCFALSAKPSLLPFASIVYILRVYPCPKACNGCVCLSLNLLWGAYACPNTCVGVTPLRYNSEGFLALTRRFLCCPCAVRTRIGMRRFSRTL
jgi:hypothetical protein